VRLQLSLRDAAIAIGIDDGELPSSQSKLSSYRDSCITGTGLEESLHHADLVCADVHGHWPYHCIRVGLDVGTDLGHHVADLLHITHVEAHRSTPWAQRRGVWREGVWR